MMRFLSFDVFPNCRDIRRANAEASVTFLPRKWISAIIHRLRRFRFQGTNKNCGRNLRRKLYEQVHVFFRSAHCVDGNLIFKRGATNFVVGDLARIGLQNPAAKFGCEDQMEIVPRIRMRHGRSI